MKIKSFPILRTKSLFEHLYLTEHHFDHRVFKWNQSKIVIIPNSSILNQHVLTSILESSSKEEFFKLNKITNHQFLKECQAYKCLPQYQTPFLFDSFSSVCYLLSDNEHYKHVLHFQKYKS